MKSKIISFSLIIFVSFTNLLMVSATDHHTKSVIDIEDITIYEIQEAFEKGYMTSELLVTLYLERIDEYNPQYEAINAINKDALETARNLDAERRDKGPRGLLHGIPIVIKDNYDFVPLPTTGGSMALWDSYPIKNSFIIQKLIDAGAVIIAKTNMSAFAFSGSSSSSSFKTTVNAYDTNYSSYGSSGGTAVAVAANLVVAGLGTDTNSSIRGPSAVNNVVGLRPTVGLISRSGILPYALERDVPGPIARTVTDLAIILDYISGFDKNDPTTEIVQNKMPETYTSYLNTDGLKGKKIGIISDFIKGDPNSNIPVLKHSYIGMEKLMEQAIVDMEKLGAEIIYIEDFYTTELYNLYNASLDGFTFCYDMNQYFKALSPSNRIKNFQDLMNDGRYIYGLSGYAAYCNSNPRTSTKYEGLLSRKAKYLKYVTDVMNEYDIDVFAYPTFKTKPITALNNSSQPNAPTSNTIAPTIGWPSIDIPMGFDDDGLPYGLQFTSGAFSEGKLIEIAYAYEQATTHRKAPSIAPNLYSIEDDVVTLMSKVDYVENYISENNYASELVEINSNLEQVKNYLSNYHNSAESPSKYISILDSNIKKLETYRSKEKSDDTLFTIILIMTSLLLYSLYRKNKRKRKKLRGR